MSQRSDFLSLMRLVVTDPEQGGRALLAMNPPMPVRWMLLAAAITVSVVLLYLLPLMTGGLSALPSPFVFAVTQVGLNIVVIAIITFAGQAFGGGGRFPDVLWLMGWLQVVTAVLLIVQMVAMMILPFLNFPLGVASIAVSVWVLVGFICAVHGFKSRVAVLIGGFMTFIVFSFFLSLILLFLGVTPAEISNV